MYITRFTRAAVAQGSSNNIIAKLLVTPLRLAIIAGSIDHSRTVTTVRAVRVFRVRYFPPLIFLTAVGSDTFDN